MEDRLDSGVETYYNYNKAGVILAKIKGAKIELKHFFNVRLMHGVIRGPKNAGASAVGPISSLRSFLFLFLSLFFFFEKFFFLNLGGLLTKFYIGRYEIKLNHKFSQSNLLFELS